MHQKRSKEAKEDVLHGVSNGYAATDTWSQQETCKHQKEEAGLHGVQTAERRRGVTWCANSKEEEGLHGVHRQLRRNEHPKTKCKQQESKANLM
jgi:hypothetical protein